ncbi:hypothetical protein AB4Y42_18465 [Paraburkholderia sp. EG286B]|uniref:hypothetical protein n=1 Tax=Paraburkholderia sp. EG286B TaxID=3237011 RepID=UPI0034D16845
MVQAKMMRERIASSASVHAELRTYLDMSAWTPSMGAMLLAGLRPEQGCTEFPEQGAVGLDGGAIRRLGDARFHEARRILAAFEEHCEDEGHRPSVVAPGEFIAWLLDDQVREQYAIFHEFEWIDIFLDVLGQSSAQSMVPVDVVQYVEESAPAMMMAKLDDLIGEVRADRRSTGGTSVDSTPQANGDFPVASRNLLRGTQGKRLDCALSTRNLADAFADNDDCSRKTGRNWLKYLQDPPQWATDPKIRLHAGSKGKGNESLWDPLEFAKVAVLESRRAPSTGSARDFFRAIDERFQKVELLRRWRKDWNDWLEDVYRPMKSGDAAGKPGRENRQ